MTSIGKLIPMTFLALALSLMVCGAAAAHELWVEAREQRDTGEVRIDIMWGHIRDFRDQASIDRYALYVRTPGGRVEQLPLEQIGVQGRAYITPDERGQYVFWATRSPGVHTPEGGRPTASIQMAKAFYYYEEAAGSNAAEPTGLLLEIVPTPNVSPFRVGTLTGHVLLDGQPAAGAKMNAYGPGGQSLELIADAQGAFAFRLDEVGDWLVKANVVSQESGTLGETAYYESSRTSTLLIQADDPLAGYDGARNFAMGALFVAGLLLGGSGVFFYTALRRGRR